MPRDREGFLTGEPERLAAASRLELEREHPHADQIRPVNALVALGDDRPDTEKQRALGGPVTGRSRAVFLAGDDDERRAFGLHTSSTHRRCSSARYRAGSA